uniref:Reverse transcriptase domain-containing protein n=1 Tax=Anguilla anguilla TaxID=7936 RepID=A0A0E9UF12_ANGAN
MLNCFVFIYLDNILILSKNLSEQINHVRLILTHILKHQRNVCFTFPRSPF